MLDRRISSNFVSYFLTLLHEEGNKYLPVRQNQTNQQAVEEPMAEPTPPPPPPASTKSFKRFNSENLFNSSMHSQNNTPQGPQASSHKRINLQSLQSNNSPKSLNSSPIDVFISQNRNKRNNNFPSPNQSSPTTNFSPKTASYSSKLTNKPPTIFDYITTPIKSPTYGKGNDTQVIITDFKNRFQQHQQQYQSNQQQIPSPNSYAQIIQPNQPQQLTPKQTAQPIQQSIPEEVQIIEKKIDEKKKKQYTELGPTVKNSLTKEDMKRLSILSKFYSQLILSKKFLSFQMFLSNFTLNNKKLNVLI